jgi:chromosomal replication initiator protein
MRGERTVANLDVMDLWDRFLAGLADSQLGADQRARLKLARPLGLVGDMVLIAVPSEFDKKQMETQLRPLVIHALSQRLGRNIQLAITVDSAAQLSTSGVVADSDLATGPSAPHFHGLQLIPRYTFETFTIGPNNKFAQAAAVAVAEAPGKAYNPLFLYGDSGLGKTHLLHAIGNHAQSLNRGIKVLYVSSGGPPARRAIPACRSDLLGHPRHPVTAAAGIEDDDLEELVRMMAITHHDMIAIEPLNFRALWVP